MNMKDSMVQQASDNIQVKKKKKGIFSRFEEKIEKDEQKEQEKQQA